MKREDVFEKIFNSYIYGNLGMFVGSGFSKAIVGNDIALNWFELIKCTGEKLNLTIPSNEDLVGVSYPELATKLCKELSNNLNITYDEAKSKFKEEICYISNWLPEEEERKKFRGIFDDIEPKWIITTNYDLVLETILTGKCSSLSPRNYLSSKKGVVPIYHIHGTRLDSESIVITQDDYIPLFRPNEYRQSKLAMIIRESTTLVLGYSLGDMNVLSALDWSRNIYTENNDYPHAIIQVVWSKDPKDEAYINENGNIIIETSDLKDFFNKLIIYMSDKKKEYKSTQEELDELMRGFDSDDAMMESFIKKSKFRINLLSTLEKFESTIISAYIEFLLRCMDSVWEKTNENHNFEAYNNYLVIILDILINYNFEKMPPMLFKILAEALNKVLNYVGCKQATYIYGDSYSAQRTWYSRKNDIPEKMKSELISYSSTKGLSRLKDYLK